MSAAHAHVFGRCGGHSRSNSRLAADEAQARSACDRPRPWETMRWKARAWRVRCWLRLRAACSFALTQALCADYGFEYSDDEPEEEDVDIENQYYNAKGAQLTPVLFPIQSRRFSSRVWCSRSLSAPSSACAWVISRVLSPLLLKLPASPTLARACRSA